MALVLRNQTKLGEMVTLLYENYNLHLTSRPEPVWRTLFHLPPDAQTSYSYLFLSLTHIAVLLSWGVGSFTASLGPVIFANLRRLDKPGSRDVSAAVLRTSLCY